MLLIPAIDLKRGQCVQLRQGAMASASTYSDDPPGMAKRWQDAGARRLHVVDLDGAFAGEPVNRQHVEDIVAAVPDLPVQVGGGIRSAEARERLSGRWRRAGDRRHSGVGRCRLSAHARRTISRPGDSRPGRPRWPHFHARLDRSQRCRRDDLRGRPPRCRPLRHRLYGHRPRRMLSGVNAAATQRLAEAAAAPVIASGGVKNLDDLRRLKALVCPPGACSAPSAARRSTRERWISKPASDYWTKNHEQDEDHPHRGKRRCLHRRGGRRTKTHGFARACGLDGGSHRRTGADVGHRHRRFRHLPLPLRQRPRRRLHAGRVLAAQTSAHALHHGRVFRIRCIARATRQAHDWQNRASTSSGWQMWTKRCCATSSNARCATSAASTQANRKAKLARHAS